MNRQTILLLAAILVPSMILSVTLVVLAVHQNQQRPVAPQHTSTPAPKPAAPRDGHTRVTAVPTGWPRFVPAPGPSAVTPSEPGGRHRPENVNTRIIPAIRRNQPGSRP